MKDLQNIVLLFVFTAILALLCGCGKESIPPDDKDNIAERVEIVWYTSGTRPRDMDKVLAVVNSYLLQKLNCTLKVRFVEDNNYAIFLNTIIAAGEDCDIAASCGNDSAAAFNYRFKAQDGYLMRLDDLLHNNAPELLERMPPVLQKSARVGNGIYVLPVPGALAKQNCLVTYSSKFRPGKAGELLSQSEMFSLFGKVRTEYPGAVCLANPGKLAGEGFDFIGSCYFPGAVRLNDTAVTVFNQFKDNDFVSRLELIRACYKAGYCVRDIGISEAASGLKSGDIFAVIEEKNGINADAAKQSGSFWRLDDHPVIRRADAGCNVFVIPVTAKHPARAVKLLNLLYTDKYLKNTLTFGIAGQHYSVPAAGRIKFLPAHGDYIVGEQTFGDPRLDYVPEGQPADKWQLVANYDKKALVSPLTGFTPEYQRIKKYIPALTAISEKYSPLLSSGSEDTIMILQRLNAELEAAGVNDYISELQRQIDSWRSQR